jgi:hypothetical protein
MVAIVTTGRGSGGARWMRQDLGSKAAAGEGTAIRVFSERHNGGVGGGCLSWHIIHTIAIGCDCARAGLADERRMVARGPDVHGSSEADRANEFAATNTRSPPARTGGSRRVAAIVRGRNLGHPAGGIVTEGRA